MQKIQSTEKWIAIQNYCI